MPRPGGEPTCSASRTWAPQTASQEDRYWSRCPRQNRSSSPSTETGRPCRQSRQRWRVERDVLSLAGDHADGADGVEVVDINGGGRAVGPSAGRAVAGNRRGGVAKVAHAGLALLAGALVAAVGAIVVEETVEPRTEYHHVLRAEHAQTPGHGAGRVAGQVEAGRAVGGEVGV